MGDFCITCKGSLSLGRTSTELRNPANNKRLHMKIFEITKIDFEPGFLCSICLRLICAIENLEQDFMKMVELTKVENIKFEDFDSTNFEELNKVVDVSSKRKGLSKIKKTQRKKLKLSEASCETETNLKLEAKDTDPVIKESETNVEERIEGMELQKNCIEEENYSMVAEDDLEVTDNINERTKRNFDRDELPKAKQNRRRYTLQEEQIILQDFLKLKEQHPGITFLKASQLLNVSKTCLNRWYLKQESNLQISLDQPNVERTI